MEAELGNDDCGFKNVGKKMTMKVENANNLQSILIKIMRHSENSGNKVKYNED